MLLCNQQKPMYYPENITEIHQNTNDGITNAHRIQCNGVLLGIVLSNLAVKGLNTIHCTAATRIAMCFFLLFAWKLQCTPWTRHPGVWSVTPNGRDYSLFSMLVTLHWYYVYGQLSDMTNYAGNLPQEPEYWIDNIGQVRQINIGAILYLIIVSCTINILWCSRAECAILHNLSWELQVNLFHPNSKDSAPK